MKKIDLLADVQGKLWIITQEGADQLQVDAVVVATQERSIESRSEDKIEPYPVKDGVAVIHVRGALAKDYGWVGWISGVHSGYLGIREQVEAALADNGVKAILLNVDSPGGTVDGCKELADFLGRAGHQKPLYTYNNGQMTSAAYWLGAQAKEIAGPATSVSGSIGVRTMHIDWSGYNEKWGLKVKHITSGKYKAEPNPDAPLGEEAEAYIQERIDQTMEIFVAGVAPARGISAEVVRAMEGRVYLAEEAKALGLIDRIEENIDTFIQHINSQEGLDMNYDKLKADHADLFNQVKAEGAQEAETANKEAVATARTEATTGVLDLVKAVCGDEIHKKVSDLHSAGVTAQQADAMKTAFATREQTPEDTEQTGRQQILSALENAHSETLPPGGKAAAENPLIADAKARAGKK